MRCRLSVVVCCALFMTACNGGKSKNTVSGTVELDGAPLSEGQITFQPKADGPHPGGGAISGGRYSVELENGSYKVIITATKTVPLGPGEASASGEKTKLVSIVSPRYNEKTELTAEVSGSTSKDFKLTSK